MKKWFGKLIDIFKRNKNRILIQKTNNMQNYGIGGTEVPNEANEALSEIAQNKTLMIEKLTADAPFKPEIVEGLTSIDDVFNHFQPSIDLEFEDAEGTAGRKPSILRDWPISG
jgi:hypothetical protein